MANGSKTNADLFDRLDRLRLELKNDIQTNSGSLRQDIQGLRTDFNNLEAGRLTRAEQAINKLQTSQGIENYKLYVLWFIITAVTGVVVSVVAARLSK